jgi:flagellar protein FlbB
MAGKAHVLGRVIVLLLLILVLAGGGVIWFDYLNLIDARTALAPVFNLLNIPGRTQAAVPASQPLNIDSERLAARLEAIDLQQTELQKQETALQTRRNEIEQIAGQLEQERKALAEEQNSFNAVQAEAETRGKNVEQNSRYLTGMPPENAVAIMKDMDDQLLIDIFRKTEEIAAAEGTTSLVSYWLSLMAPDRAAELQRKMTIRP